MSQNTGKAGVVTATADANSMDKLVSAPQRPMQRPSYVVIPHGGHLGYLPSGE